jgi:hypothetical protein
VEEEMKRVAVLIFLMALCITSFAAEGAESTFPSGTKLAPAKKVELILSEKEYAHLDYPSRPCVLDDMVNMIPNEKVLVEAEVKEGRLVNLQHVDKNEHSERTIELEFSQNQDKKSPFMMLSLKNPFEKGLKYEALVQYHGLEGFRKTSTIVVQPRLASFESWPDPLTRILLRNFQLVDTKE